MSTLIRIQFGPCYLDFEIQESCRGSGDVSRLQDVIRLGNLSDFLDATENNGEDELITFAFSKFFGCALYVHTQRWLQNASSADPEFATAMQLHTTNANASLGIDVLLRR